MNWQRSWRADPQARALADRHYNRQSVGATQFVPPGRCLVLITDRADAFWVSSWPFAAYVQHAWAGAWICSAFRNEGAVRSSALILEAVAATRATWPEPPELGMVTFVDPTQVRRKRDPGRCYLRAGFVRASRCGACHEETFAARGLCPWCGADAIGKTAAGLLAFQMWPHDMPTAQHADERRTDQMDLFA